MNDLDKQDMSLWREFLSDPVYGAERMARVRAAKHGNRHAFESIRDDYVFWRADQQQR